MVPSFIPYVIQTQKDHGKTQQEIGDSIGWSPQKVSDYSNVCKKISANILERAKSHQGGRADNKSAVADFTEGWFRNSGLYNLSEKYQEEAPCKDHGKTQQEIGDSIGWNESKVKQYSVMMNKVTPILDIAKQHQSGRVTNEVTNVTFNFTEGWFRNSGLYNLSEKYQEDFFNRFIEDKMNWTSSKVKAECSKYQQWQDLTKIAENELLNKDDMPVILELIEMGAFKNERQLRDKIAAMNKKAKNKLLCGDSCTLLDSIEDCTIDLVITDPPYGMNYISARSEYSDSITKTGIMNDDSNALEIFKCVMEKLNNKTKPDAGFYVFCSWKTYPDFKLIVEQYAEIKNLIIWDKGNHGAGDLDHAWGNKYECIIYATKDSRKLNIRMQDIITVPRVNSTLARHPTQKPVELITKLLTASARKQDVVCDPFMGSGATIKAVKEYGDLNYIGIELDESIFKKTCIWIGGDIDG